ncbi:GPR endopeptidase [Lutispora thermophila]|uniref:Germination protease n=1 Tax=Lutispora thermophila DSM 19022 TaxID=1122184 RepID=A0A1M6DC08_9FIRM|nr:GPR endopeptidase [Lutispora thermophila]SHI70703.1 spore protease [Lutispora thermophila DSM 19022]
MTNIRTDLALEVKELHESTSNESIPGVSVVTDGNDDIRITRVRVEDEIGARLMGKPVGNYITLEIPRLKEKDIDLMEDVSRALAKELIKLIKLNDKSVILVVGLGNWNITPDSLGPKVVEKIMVTRHMREYLPEQIDESVRSVCAISPGVLGITGIETSEIILGVVNKVKPDVVIAIDALASRKLQRVNTTIQISDSGINPGSGVGNNRKELSEKTMGVPVIAIGVPTVVDAATMANDTIDMVIDNLIKEAKNEKSFYEMLRNIDREEKMALISEVLSPQMGSLMVTPKEIDDFIEEISDVIADGLNISLHPGIHMDDVHRFTN